MQTVGGQDDRNLGPVISSTRLEHAGLHYFGCAYWNLPPAALYEHAVTNDEASVSADGAIVASTGEYTGRSPNDKFIVDEPSTSAEVSWGDVNKPFSEEKFDRLYDRVTAYLQGSELYVQDLYAGADADYRLNVRVVTEQAWHSLFAHNMFIRPTAEERADFVPGFTVVQAPGFKAVPEIDGTNSEVAVIVNFKRKLVLVCGTAYAGEIKKSIFGVMNHILPGKGVMPMHCSANVGPEGDTAVFFGLSGTGKTTLSADASRTLIGDDEHGWSDKGVFNFEGGCYAKAINLSPTGEPEIYATTKRFGTVLENVAMDLDTHELDFDDGSHTENTRVSYPIDFIPNASATGEAGMPTNIIMLTADAFGVLPPVSKLTPEQAMYHFISGYTAKLAGTERGVTTPQAAFSACFGAPFMSRDVTVYAKLLGEKIAKHGVNCWLVNTGWSGGSYGVGKRMKLAYTRAMVTAALNGELAKVETQTDAVFGLHMPVSCPNVPDEVLDPKLTWADPAAYDAAATNLAKRFEANFAKYQSTSDASIQEAAIKVAA
ncbi:MAG: phosphoenolpyruvate carboxykinase [Alphaproteobacteria bacterium]